MWICGILFKGTTNDYYLCNSSVDIATGYGLLRFPAEAKYFLFSTTSGPAGSVGNAQNIRARNNKTKELCNPFLSNRSVNTRTTTVENGFLFGPCEVVIQKVQLGIGIRVPKFEVSSQSRVEPCKGG
jgi:hypothetical protein